jgi:hypothetical protein
MAEDTEMVQKQTPEPEAETATEVEVGKDGTPFDPERAQATIEKLRQEAKEAKALAKRLAELEAKEEERKMAELSDLEKANKRAEALEAELKATKLREMRTRIGTEAKLPAEIAALLQGDTEEAMKEHAAKLVAALPKPASLTPTNPPNGQPTVTDEQRRKFLYNGGPLPQ